MAANNLRIVYENEVLSATASAVAPVTVTNCLNDYRSQTDQNTTFVVTTNSLTGTVAVMVLLAEEIRSNTMTVTPLNGTASAITESTTSISNTAPVGYGGGKYITKYITLTAATTTFTIVFNRSVKVSKIVIGNYWSPKFNTSYGVQIGYDDASTTERLQSGDLYVTNGPRHKTLQFDLQYIDQTEKFKLYDIIKQIGKSKGIFISVFPEDTDKEREQMYSMYGRFLSMPGITHSSYTLYSSSIQLEEI
jgi:hypothetical protein